MLIQCLTSFVSLQLLHLLLLCLQTHAQEALQPAEYLARLGLRAADGSYSSSSHIELQSGIVRLVMPTGLFPPPAPVLCNLVLQGKQSASELDAAGAWPSGQNVFRIGRGCTVVIKDILLRVTDLTYVKTLPQPISGSTTQPAPSPAQSLSLSPAFAVNPGGLLILEGVTIRAAGVAAFYSGICNVWSYSASAQLNSAGELRLAGQHATTTGLLLRNVTILPAEGLRVLTPQRSTTSAFGSDALTATSFLPTLSPRPPAPPSATNAAAPMHSQDSFTLPCRASTAHDAASLSALLLGSLEVQRPLYISLTGNVTIDPDAWTPVSIINGATFTLLGDPRGVTQIDFAGLRCFVYLALGSRDLAAAGVVQFHDLTIINAIAWDAPTSILTSLTSTVQPVMTRRDDSKLVGSYYQPQVILLRCIVYVPDAEAEWMRYALPPVSLFKPPQESVNAVWSWMSTNYANMFVTLNVTAYGSGPKGGTYVSHLVHESGFVAITQSLILPVSAYPDQSQVLLEARRWLLHELLGKPHAALTPVASLHFIRRNVGISWEYFSILQRLTMCMLRNRPVQLVVSSSAVVAEPSALEEVMQLRETLLQLSAQQTALGVAAAAAAIAGNISYLAFGPGALSQVPNCSLLSVPNPRGIPRFMRRYNTGDYLTMRPDQNIYKLLDAGNISAAVFDLQGMHAELIVDPTKTINIGRMILMNLAPGGYAYDWATSRMLPVDGWAEAQGPLAAGFANQSLPVWWLQANRSSSMHVLQLYDVVLIVPQEEVELMHALIQAVAVLRQHGLVHSALEFFAQRSTNNVPAAAAQGWLARKEEQAQPIIKQMLKYALAWEVEFSSNTSLRFRRWSYLGVAGEGVSITSQVPKDYNASMTVSRVVDATAGLLGLAAEIYSFVADIANSKPVANLPALPDEGAPSMQSQGAAAAAQPASPSNVPAAHVLALSLAAGSIAVLLAAMLAVLVVVRKRRLLQQGSASLNKLLDSSSGSIPSLCFSSLFSQKMMEGNRGQGYTAGSSSGCSFDHSCSTVLSATASSSRQCARIAAMSEVRALQVQLQAEGRPGVSPTACSGQRMPIDRKACSLNGPGPVLLSNGPALLPPQPVAKEAVLWLNTQRLQRVPVATIRSMASSSIAAGRSEPDIKTPACTSAEHARSFSAQLVLGPVLGQGARSMVHIGTWNMMPVAVKMVVVQNNEPRASAGQRAAMRVSSRLQAVLSEVAKSTSVCHPNVVACLAYNLQPWSDLQPMPSTNSSSTQSPGRAISGAACPGSRPCGNPTQPNPSTQVAFVQTQQQQDSSSRVRPGWPAAAAATAVAVPNGVMVDLQAAHDCCAGAARSDDSRPVLLHTALVTAAHLGMTTAPIQGVDNLSAEAASAATAIGCGAATSCSHNQLPPPPQHEPNEPGPSAPTHPTAISSVPQQGYEYDAQAPGALSTASGSQDSSPGAWRLCMVLEYCNGGTLHELIESGTLTPHWVHALSDAPSGAPLEPGAARDVEVLLLAWQVAVGMGYLASLGVVHGSLSAYNVLLHSLPASETITELYTLAGYDTTTLPTALSGCCRLAKITDFRGAARLQPKNAHATCQPGGVRGLYAAPELLHGGVLCEACDVYSFGVLLLELWYGMPAVQIAEAHGGSLFPSVNVLHDELLPDTPSSLSCAPSGTGLLSTSQLKVQHTDPSSCASANFDSTTRSPPLPQRQHCKEGQKALLTTFSDDSTDNDNQSGYSSAGFSLDRPTTGCRLGMCSLPAPLHFMVERCLSEFAPQRPTFAELHVWLGGLLAQRTLPYLRPRAHF